MGCNDLTRASLFADQQADAALFVCAGRWGDIGITTIAAMRLFGAMHSLVGQQYQ